MNSPRYLLLATFVAGTLAGAALLGRLRPSHAPHDEAATPATAAGPSMASSSSSSSSARKVRFYQSPMHPWIQSDQPGRCTICGMELTPVYEGDAGAALDGPAIVLGTNAIQLIHLETAEVATGPLERTLRLSGTVDDDDTRHRVVSAPVAGRIERLAVNQVGQEIRAGQPLLTLYSPTLLTAEREYVALLRQPPPSEASGAMAPILASARQRLLQMGLTTGQVEALKDKPADAITSDLLARADGTVVLKQVYEGQYVAEGERLFETADFSTMWVQLTAYEADRAWLAVGQEARITTPSWDGGVVTGRVSFIDPNYDPMTRSSRVRVEVPNPIGQARDGQRRRLLHRVTAVGEIAHADTARVVPRSALLWNGRQAVAYRSLGGGAFERRTVRVGRIGDRSAEILEGLEDGDRIVSQAAFLIDAQAQIRGGPGGLAGSGETGSSGNPPAAPKPRPPTPEALAAFLRLAAELSEALAADRLPDFQAKVSGFAGRLAAVRQWAEDGPPPAPEAVRRALATLHAPPDGFAPASLAEARRWFLDPSRPMVDLARAARRQGWDTGVRAFECPMVDRAIPSAPKRAGWLQLGGPVRNPYFGAEMLDCGLELKETP